MTQVAIVNSGVANLASIICAFEAFGVEVKAGTRFDLKSAEDRELDVFVENGTYQNRLVNRVNHKYRAPRPEVSAVA